MIIEEKKLWFRTAFVLFDEEAARRLAAQTGWGRISVLSYRTLEIPGFRLLQHKTTGIIDLQRKTAEDALGAFNDTTRNEIRRTFNVPGIRVAISPCITDDAYALYLEFERTQLGRVPFPKRHFKDCWEVAIIEGSGTLLSCIWVYTSSPIARVRSIFSARYSEHDKERKKLVSNASRRAMYEACIECIRRNLDGLDLASVDPEGTGYKNSFNPMIVDEYLYVRTTPTYRFFEKVMETVRRFRANIRRRFGYTTVVRG